MLNKSNFISIFSSKDEKTGIISERKVIIPIIQRDYAQGRTDEHATRIREKFLNALHDAIIEQPITLDFIYGDIDENNTITLLDGQQRITTLFLLHWYAAKKCKIEASEYSFLKRFGYDTRFSSRVFCEKLVDYKPSFNYEKLSDEIKDQSWFTLGWKDDPTIKSMLVMLDSIDKHFKKTPNLWEKLKGEAITFYFLPIEDMGLTDELYIKMNSRGKPLTEFENFKAELEGEIANYSKDKAFEISKKIDGAWTDLLWQYRDESNTIDSPFLNLFRIICQTITYKEGGSFKGFNGNSLDLLKHYYNSKLPEFEDHLRQFEQFFDTWQSIFETENLTNYFQKYFSFEHDKDKIKIKRSLRSIDLLKDCTQLDDKKSVLKKIIFLHAFDVFIQNKHSITEDQFKRRLRVINNLILNSTDEIDDNEDRDGGNRMPAILQQTKSIILNGTINDSLSISFNTNQLEEEKEKLQYTTSNPEQAESLFELEDHDLLSGQIAILGIENHNLFNRFLSLFNCDYDKISCALLATNNYAQKIGKKHSFYQLGSSNTRNAKAWYDLFHRSTRNIGFEENTKRAFVSLLTEHESFTNSILDTISNDYINKCNSLHSYDWRYYFIKYESFRPREKSFGKYWRLDYEMLVMVTEKQLSKNAYSPYTKEVQKRTRGAYMCDYLGQTDLLHMNGSNYYYRYSQSDIEVLTIELDEEKQTHNDNIIKRIPINQNEIGIDTEDRILKLINTINHESTEIVYDDSYTTSSDQINKEGS